MEEKICSCSIVVCIEESEIQSDMKPSFQAFLRDVNMPFGIIEFVPAISSSHPEPFEERETFRKNVQSLAVCLFLKEPSDYKSQHELKKQLLQSPWKLNHVFESPLHVRPRKIARQEFYSFSNDLPLWSVNTVHYGNEHVRIHINARNFSAMEEFYETLTDHKAMHCGSNFCFFTIYSENELDVQIGLKFCPAVAPSPSKTCRIKFRVQGHSPLFKYLESLVASREETDYVLEDPDGNEVIVERLCIAEPEENVPQIHENTKAECDVMDSSTTSNMGCDEMVQLSENRLTNGSVSHKECTSLCADHGRCSCEIENDNDGYNDDLLSRNGDDYVMFV